MKIRILSIASVTTAAALLAACTAVYKNTDACEQLMRSKLAQASPDKLKITHTGAGIHGSRVVVEGSIEHVVPASAPAVTSAASTASTASAPLAGSGTPAASAAAIGASGSAGVVGASVAAASATTASAANPRKVQKIVTPAAAECTFNGPTLNVFSWLAPASLVTPAASATE
jgi:hypothetical protein